MKYGHVVGTFYAAVGDSPDDSDEYPDKVPLSGSVTFRPRPSMVIDRVTPGLMFPAAIVAMLDENGRIAYGENDGVWLVATDDEDLNPVNWTYSVAVELSLDGKSLPKVSPFSIHVPADATVELSEVVPVPSSPGKPNVQGIRGSRWYLSGIEYVDYVDVPNPLPGDVFLYVGSNDVFQFTGSTWEYAGSL